jgi:geranylgeranyl reductase family protein
MHDVIVAGAGPVGSRVAERLAGLGHGVLVIDRKPEISAPVCCTGIVSEECVRAFSIEETVILRHARSARVVSPFGNTINLVSDCPRAVILDRPAFNVLMADRARSLGAEYMTGSRITSLELRPGFVEVSYSQKGTERTVSARVVVIASGFSQELVTKAGLRRSNDLVAGAQAEIDAPELSEVCVYVGARFAPGFFAWVVPTRGGKALVGLLARRAARKRLKEFLSSLAGSERLAAQDAPITVSAVTLKPLDRTYGDRLLIAGTAAGQVKPITGGGIYYGLLCADLAAQTLDSALRSDDLSRKSLSRYQHAWKTLLADELRTAYRARRLYERLSDRRIDALLTAMSSRGLVDQAIRSGDVSFDWHGRSIRHLLRFSTLAKLIGGM